MPLLGLSWDLALLLFQQGDKQLGRGVGTGRNLKGRRSPLNGNPAPPESSDSWLLFLVLAKSVYPEFSKQMFLSGEGELVAC